jgi:hypothetical protein
MGFGKIVTDGERLRDFKDKAEVRYRRDGTPYNVRTGKQVQGTRWYQPAQESLADYRSRMKRLCLDV